MPGRRTTARPRPRCRCSGCPGCGVDTRELVSERALWWIGKALSWNTALGQCFDSVGFFWVYQTTLQVFLPETVVMWFLALFCSSINIVTMLEESIPYFKLCEYVVPLFGTIWFVLSSALYGAPTCKYFLYAIAWLSYETSAFIFNFLFSTLMESSAAAETWREICFQVFILAFLLPCFTAVLLDFNEVDSSDVALIKDFGGCNCECEGTNYECEVNKWSFGAEKRRELLVVARCFELLRSGLSFSDLPLQLMIKVANFVEEKAKKQTQVQEVVSLKYQCCMSCGEVSHDNLDNAQLLSQNEVSYEKTSAEVTVKIYQIIDESTCETFSQKDPSKTNQAVREDDEDIRSYTYDPNDYETTTCITPELVLSDENELKEKQKEIVPIDHSSPTESVTMITGCELSAVGAKSTVIETQPPLIEVKSTETKYETAVVLTKFENEEKPNDNNAVQSLVKPQSDDDHTEPKVIDPRLNIGDNKPLLIQSSIPESPKRWTSENTDNILNRLIEENTKKHEESKSQGEPTKKRCGQDSCQEKASLQLCSR